MNSIIFSGITLVYIISKGEKKYVKYITSSILVIRGLSYHICRVAIISSRHRDYSFEHWAILNHFYLGHFSSFGQFHKYNKLRVYPIREERLNLDFYIIKR